MECYYKFLLQGHPAAELEPQTQEECDPHGRRDQTRQDEDVEALIITSTAGVGRGASDELAAAPITS